jgi:membrane-associated HD superfamily phosphohydrolase
MKQFSTSLLVCSVIFFLSFTAVAQQKTNVNTDIDIVKVYEQTVREGYPTLEIYQKLATTQYFRSNYKEAKKWFEKWFEMEAPKDKVALVRYKQTLKALRVSFENNKYLAVVINQE